MYGDSNPSFTTFKSLYEAFFMFTLYVLYSEIFDKIYIGDTSNKSERLYLIMS